MRLTLTTLLVFAAGGLCCGLATPALAGGLPVCNAKHKRPANPYGSVLSAGVKPAAAAADPKTQNGDAAVAGTDDVAPSAAAKPQRISRTAWRASLAPCGRDQA